MTVSLCPAPTELERLFLGGLPEQEAELLEKHVLECEACLRKLKELMPANDLLSDVMVLRHSAGGATEALSPMVDDLMKSIVALHPPCPSGSQKNSTQDDSEGMTQSFLIGPEMEGTRRANLAQDIIVSNLLAPPQANDELGRLGKYRILKVLGAGGMGIVFQAEDLLLKRSVAIKLMLPSLAADAGQRFLLEAQAMAAVKHEHIVTIYQADQERGVFFFAMELLQGEPLQELLNRREPLPVGEVLRIGREIAEALAAAHKTGLIHRDVKPANIWLEADPALAAAHPSGRVKLLDFGLARIAAQPAHLTQHGMLVGTPAYMSPEQVRGGPVAAHCDLFSLGVVLYQMCTGLQPFHGPDSFATLLQVSQHHPAAPVTLNAELPVGLSNLIMQLLQKDADKRPASADAVVRALQSLQNEGQEAEASGHEKSGTARSPLAPRRSPLFSHPRRLVWGVLLLLIGLAALALALIYIQAPQGTYVIDTDDDDIFFRVNKEGGVTLEDHKTKKSYHLKVQQQDKGEFVLDVSQVENGSEVAFKVKTFTIKRGEKVALKAWFERKAEAVAPPPQVAMQVWLKQVAALPGDKQLEAVIAKLKERNPEYDGTYSHGAVEGVESHLELRGKVSDLSAVRALSGLQALTLHRTGVSDLTPLKDMKLKYLNFGYTRVSDLKPLQGMPLSVLDCSHTDVSELSPLAGMKLTLLWCDHTKVTDLKVLGQMPVAELRCDFVAERDAEILRSIKTLKRINKKGQKQFWKELDANP
jgi:serine/threonine protein kinase